MIILKTKNVTVKDYNYFPPKPYTETRFYVVMTEDEYKEIVLMKAERR